MEARPNVRTRRDARKFMCNIVSRQMKFGEGALPEHPNGSSPELADKALPPPVGKKKAPPKRSLLPGFNSSAGTTDVRR
jgi:hypothetical protein